jgi:hypothetical protein
MVLCLLWITAGMYVSHGALFALEQEACMSAVVRQLNCGYVLLSSAAKIQECIFVSCLERVHWTPSGWAWASFRVGIICHLGNAQ